MGKLAYIAVTLASAGGALGWVNRSVPDPYSWAEVLPFSVASPHTNLYRAAFFFIVAVMLKGLGRLPKTDRALASLLKGLMPVNARRGFCVIALMTFAVLSGWWVSANSQLPDFFGYPPLDVIPFAMRLEFVQIVVVTIVLTALYLILFIHWHHARNGQDLALRYADNLLIWKKREQTLDPLPPVGRRTADPSP